jgi:CRISPR/Cas system-associated protein Cas7 (RAMP superfamily)
MNYWGIKKWHRMKLKDNDRQTGKNNKKRLKKNITSKKKKKPTHTGKFSKPGLTSKIHNL